MNVIRWITDRIFGFDVFISYSRKDGVAYARKLEEELLQSRLRCFLDSKEMPPGSALKASLLSAVARSTALVLVASPGSLESTYMPAEFDNYTKSRKHRTRRIIPISIGRTLDDAPRDLPIIARLRNRADVIWISEQPDRLVEGPSEDTLGSLLASFRFTRRNAIRDYIVSSVCIVLVVALVVAVKQWRTSVAERNVAQRALSATSYRLATDASKDDRDEDALAYLAQAVQTDPTNEVATSRLLSLLLYRRWPVEDYEVNHGVPLISGEFSPDCRTLLTSGSDGTAKIWDSANGTLLHTLVQGEPMRQAGFSPDGSRIVTAGGKTAHVWDSRTGRQIGSGILEDYPITEFAFEPGGTRVAVACEGPDDNAENAPPPPGCVSIVDIATGKTAGPKIHDRKGVSVLAWRPADTCLALGAGSTIEMWDVNTNRARYPEMEYGGSFSPTITALKFGGGGRWLLAAGGAYSDGSVAEDGIEAVGYARIWDASDGRPLNRKPDFDRSIPRTLSDESWMRDVEMDESEGYSSDFGAIFTAADSGKIAGWGNGASFEHDDDLSMKLDLPVERLELDQTGSLLAIANDRASGAGYVRQWQYGTSEDGNGGPLSQRMEHQGLVLGAAWSPDGRRILTVGDDGIGRVWWTGECSAKGESGDLPDNDDATKSDAASDDNDPAFQKLVEAHIYTNQDQLAHRINLTNDVLSDEAPIPEALTTQLAKVVTVPKANRTRFLIILGVRSYRAFRSPDNHWLVTSECGDRRVSARGDVWDLMSGKKMGSFPVELPIQDIAFAGDASEFAVASGYFISGKVRVYNTRSVRQLTPSFKGPGMPQLLCFAPGGTRLAVGFAVDPMANYVELGIYDVSTGSPLVDPSLSGPLGDTISFSSDGQRIVVRQYRDNITYDAPAATAPAPDWLPDLARIVAHRDIDDSNSVRRIQDIGPRTEALKKKLEEAPPSLTKTIAQWFFANPVDRSVAPLATETYRHEMESEIQEWTKDADRLIKNGTGHGDSDPDPIECLKKARSLESDSFGDIALLDLIIPVEKKIQDAGMRMLSQEVTNVQKTPKHADVSGLKSKLREFRGLTAMNPALIRETENLQDRMEKSFPVKSESLPPKSAQTGEE